MRYTYHQRIGRMLSRVRGWNDSLNSMGKHNLKLMDLEARLINRFNGIPRPKRRYA